MNSGAVIKVLASGLKFPEGPAFDSRGGLWCVELKGAGLVRWEDGLVYVAVYSTGQIKAVASDGTIARVIDLPGANPTNCAFDPSGKSGLVVTEAERGLLLSLEGLGPGLPLFVPAWS
jgi:sugar lactone lactonase YvrE